MPADSITNSALASQVQELLQLWLARETQYQTWVNGVAGGGDYSNGTYPLTDPSGVTRYVKSPAQLQSEVDGALGSGSASATAAAGSATAAANSATAAAGSATAPATSATSATASAASANTYQLAAASAWASAGAAAGAAAGSATAAATSATNAATSETNAAASATAASTSAANAASSATSAAASATSAAASAAAAAASVSGEVRFQGMWDASTGIFPGSPTKGDLWQVSVQGTISTVIYRVGDQILYTGTTWAHIDNAELVLSVAGRTGAVTLTSSDVGLGSVSNALQLTAANNLSDLTSTSSARTNIGLGNVTNDKQLTVANNLSDVNSVGVTLNNLGVFSKTASDANYSRKSYQAIKGLALTNTTPSSTATRQWGTSGTDQITITNPGVPVSIVAMLTGQMTNSGSTNVGSARVQISTDGGTTYTTGNIVSTRPEATTSTANNLAVCAQLVLDTVTPTGNIIISAECTNINGFDFGLTFNNGYLSVVMQPV